jgi:hypothetical protein
MTDPTAQPHIPARTTPCDSPYPPSIPANTYEPATTNPTQQWAESSSSSWQHATLWKKTTFRCDQTTTKLSTSSSALPTRKSAFVGGKNRSTDSSGPKATSAHPTRKHTKQPNTHSSVRDQQEDAHEHEENSALRWQHRVFKSASKGRRNRMHPRIQMVQPYWNGRSHSLVQVLHMKPIDPMEKHTDPARLKRSVAVDVRWLSSSLPVISLSHNLSVDRITLLCHLENA